MPAIALVIAAAKAGCFIVGSLVHEVNEVMKRLGVDHDDTPRASCLLIKDDEQLGLELQETPNESPSPSIALIRYAPREVVLSSSSRDLALLSNDALALEATFNVIEDFLPIMKNFNFFAAWARFRARFIALVQSALHLVITDMKMAMSSFIGSVSESVVEKKAVTSIAFLIQENSSRVMALVTVILKEASRLLKSRYARSMFKLLGQIFPAGIRGDALPDNSSFGDSALVEVGTCAQHYLAKVIACVKRALAMIFSQSASLLSPLQLHGPKVMTLVLLLCVSISVIGWSIPMMIFEVEGSQSEQDFEQKALILEAVSEVEVEAGAFSPIKSQIVYLSEGPSNALSLTESINNFDELQPVSMATRTSDDLDHLGLTEFHPIQHLWPANDFSFTSMPDLQTSYLWDDVTTAVSLVEWNIIQSNSGYRYGLETALETSLLMCVYVQELLPSKDRASSEIATEHFTDEFFGLNALQNHSFVESELGIAFDGVTSTTLTTIAAGLSQEFSTIRISSLSREVDVDTDPMHFDYRYFDSMAVQEQDVHMGLDHPGLVLHFMSVEVYQQQQQSESPPFICKLGDLSSDRFGTSHFSVVVAESFDGYTVSIYSAASANADETLIFTSSFVAQDSQNESSVESESLGRYILSRSVSCGNALSTQMIVAELGGSDDIYPIQCQHFDRSSALDATCTHPLLRIPAPFGRIWASASMSSSSSPTRFSAAASPSMRFGALEEFTRLHIFLELRQLAWILLLMAYRNSDDDDGATNEPDVVLSSESEISPGTDLALEELFDDEIIFVNEKRGSDEAFVRNTNTKSSSSRQELVALRSELGRHWNSPSKRRTRESYRIHSRPKYFEPTWA